LKKHSTLAQDTSDAEAVHSASSYILICKTAYSSLVSLGQSGQLPEAVQKGEEVKKLVDDMPEFISQTLVAKDLKVSLQTLNKMFFIQITCRCSKS